MKINKIFFAIFIVLCNQIPLHAVVICDDISVLCDTMSVSNTVVSNDIGGEVFLSYYRNRLKAYSLSASGAAGCGAQDNSNINNLQTPSVSANGSVAEASKSKEEFARLQDIIHDTLTNSRCVKVPDAKLLNRLTGLYGIEGKEVCGYHLAWYFIKYNTIFQEGNASSENNNALKEAESLLRTILSEFGITINMRGIVSGLTNTDTHEYLTCEDKQIKLWHRLFDLYGKNKALVDIFLSEIDIEESDLTYYCLSYVRNNMGSAYGSSVLVQNIFDRYFSEHQDADQIALLERCLEQEANGRNHMSYEFGKMIFLLRRLAAVAPENYQISENVRLQLVRRISSRQGSNAAVQHLLFDSARRSSKIEDDFKLLTERFNLLSGDSVALELYRAYERQRDNRAGKKTKKINN